MVLADTATVVGTRTAKKIAARLLRKAASRAPLIGSVVNCVTALVGTVIMGEVWIALCKYAATHDVGRFEEFLESPVAKQIRREAQTRARKHLLKTAAWSDIVAKFNTNPRARPS
jgi:hypothetical protein